MTQKDEWSEWYQHDGKGRPVAYGAFIHVVSKAGQEDIGPLTRGGSGKTFFEWDEVIRVYRSDANCIIRYRIKKPRGLTLLEDIARTVDHKSPADTPSMDAFEGAR